MSDKQINEKDEKELQKHEEKSAEEKSFEEKYTRDPLGSLTWALIFIWAGVVLLADNLGYLKSLTTRFSDLPADFPIEVNVGAWGLVFFGAGVILLIEVLIRYLRPEYRRPLLGNFILAVVFLGIGLNSFDLIWPLILIALGLGAILRGTRRKV